MKCSSRRNCNLTIDGLELKGISLNEVQLPKELQQSSNTDIQFGNGPQ